MGTTGSGTVRILEAEMLESCVHFLQRKTQHPADGAGERGIHDRYAPGAEVVVPRDRGRVHGRQAIAGKLVCKSGWRLRRINQDPATGLQACNDRRADERGPDVLVVFAVAEGSVEADQLKTEMNRRIKQDLNPLFKVHEIHFIDAMPRTESNKVMRRRLRDELVKHTTS